MRNCRSTSNSISKEKKSWCFFNSVGYEPWLEGDKFNSFLGIHKNSEHDVNFNYLQTGWLNQSFNFLGRPLTSFISLLLVFGFFLAFQASVYSQTCPPNSPGQLDLRSNYTSGGCSANDIRIDTLFLTTDDLCNSCDPGEIITVNMKVTLTNNANSKRYPSIQGDLKITPLGEEIPTTCTVLICNQL